MSQKENKTALVAKKNGSKTSITNFLKLAKYAEKYLEEETKLATELSRIKRLRKKLNLKKKHITTHHHLNLGRERGGEITPCIE